MPNLTGFESPGLFQSNPGFEHLKN